MLLPSTTSGLHENGNYHPLQGVKHFTLAAAHAAPRVLIYRHNNVSYLLLIKKNGHIPKSGLLLCETITDRVRGKTVCEIGTGETGIVAIHASRFKAKNVLAIDINKKTLQWAKKNGDLNAIENIKWKCGDLLNGVRGKFDLIITNPPQMPMISGPQHDWGGKNGRIFIDRIIHSAPAHLNPNGKLIMLLFDFLNVVSPYGDIETIVETCRNNNLIAKVISKKIRYINPDGKTIKSLPVIKNAYPRYKFKKKGDKLFHYVYVLSCAKRD